MEIRLDELAQLVGGQLHGDPSLICRGAGPLGQTTADEVTMVDDVTRARRIDQESFLAVITPALLEDLARPQIVVDDPHATLAAVVARFRPPRAACLPGVGVNSTAAIASSAKIHPTATVCGDVTIGQRTLVMPGVVIMPGCRIGDDCVLHPGVVLYEYTSLADRVILHAGTVIGANGFGYRTEDGRHLPTAQLGHVEIESDVEVGACVTIDRGTYGATRIGEGTKIDNQVMIAHNCQIGRHNLICSQVGIAGSCRTGDHVVLAGQVGLKDHIALGDRTVVAAQAGVMEDVGDDQVYLGSPAMPQRDQMQIFAIQRKLPEMRRELKQLRRQIQQLTADQSDTTGDATARRAA